MPGLKHLGLDLSTIESILYSFRVGAMIAVLGKIALSEIKPEPITKNGNRFDNVEKYFGYSASSQPTQ